MNSIIYIVGLVVVVLFVLSMLVAGVVLIRRRRKAVRSAADAAPIAPFTVVAPDLRDRHRHQHRRDARLPRHGGGAAGPGHRRLGGDGGALGP